MRIVYIGPEPGVIIAATDQEAPRGVPIDVDDDVAGAAPSERLEVGDAGQELVVLDPGYGLLAQVDNWAVPGDEPAPSKKPKSERVTEVTAPATKEGE